MKKYWKYAVYSSKAQLKSEIANSYLNWLWWVLDPLCFMLIYVFMFGYVFKSKQQYFAIFVFIGITFWDFFNKCLIQSVKLIKANKPIVSKVYIPKFILILVKMGVNGFKMFISLLIIVAMLAVWRVPITYNDIDRFSFWVQLLSFTLWCICRRSFQCTEYCTAFPVLSDRYFLEYHGSSSGTIQQLYRSVQSDCILADIST